MPQQFGANLDDYGFEKYEENSYPIAYLITFRTFGNWLHGDERGAMQRSWDKRFPTILVDPNQPLRETMRGKLKQESIVLTFDQRAVVEVAMKETCEFRGYGLRASNVRTNHVHSVISALVKPEKVVNELKSYATRRLRQAGEFGHSTKIWARGGSTRYLWKPSHVAAAIEYVLYSQGDVPFDVVTEIPED